uniref:Putative ABC transport system ATP-binding protein n=1 Tax=Candidatus Kentrum sp. FW TaxID=2126338 RepID=A0A450TMG8_9GAMM|nr:MAG: putative ABC transport system ATP-binding protein [Candidatus Kentron sp. FW]
MLEKLPLVNGEQKKTAMILEAIGIGRKVADRWLFEDLSLSISAGRQLALIGPSGSGKTLLLRTLAMLDPIDAGEIRWRGKLVTGDEIPNFRSRIMFLPQRPALPEGTVEEILRQPFSLRVHGAKSFHRERIIALLISLGRTEAFLQKQQRNLSGGEAQLVALLRAIQLDPDVLLLDEPSASLDPEATEMVTSLITTWFELLPEERATVWITHDHEQARRITCSVLRIHDGRLHDAAPEEEIFRQGERSRSSGSSLAGH